MLIFAEEYRLQWNPVKELKVITYRHQKINLFVVESGEGIESSTLATHVDVQKNQVESGEGIES